MSDPLKFGIMACGKTPRELSESIICSGYISEYLRARGYVPSGYHTFIAEKKDKEKVKLCGEKLYYLSRASDLVITVGADGFSKDDIIPEITSKICSREVNFFTCILCGYILDKVKGKYRPSGSRAGVCAGSLVLNMRCDREFVSEVLPIILPEIEIVMTEISGKNAVESKDVYDKMTSVCDSRQFSLKLAEI